MCTIAGSVIGPIIDTIIKSQLRLADKAQPAVSHGACAEPHKKAGRSPPSQCEDAAMASHAAKLAPKTPNCAWANSRRLLIMAIDSI
jgi:hypothetical protein